MLMKERRCVHVPEWLNAEMHPTGARGGYRFLLETPDFAVKLLRGVPNRPPIYVEMRAYGLHTHEGGELAACRGGLRLHPRDAARRPGPSVGGGGRDGGHGALLAAGPVPRLAGRLASRLRGGRRRAPLRQAGACRRGPPQRQRRGDRLRHRQGRRARPHLQQVGGDAEEQAGVVSRAALRAQRRTASILRLDLWRLEFQLRREGVKGFRLYAKPEMSDPDEVIDAELDAEDLPHIHSVRKALHWAGKLFAYLTKRWLRLVVPTDDPNPRSLASVLRYIPAKFGQEIGRRDQ